MPPYHYKSWFYRQLELGGGLMLAIVLLPLILVLLRPLLVVVALGVVIAVAVRGISGYIAQRRQRW